MKILALGALLSTTFILLNWIIAGSRPTDLTIKMLLIALILLDSKQIIS